MRRKRGRGREREREKERKRETSLSVGVGVLDRVSARDLDLAFDFCELQGHKYYQQLPKKIHFNAGANHYKPAHSSIT